jgi:hypothetical protein
MIIAGRPLKRPALCTSATLPLMPALDWVRAKRAMDWLERAFLA